MATGGLTIEILAAAAAFLREHSQKPRPATVFDVLDAERLFGQGAAGFKAGDLVYDFPVRHDTR